MTSQAPLSKKDFVSNQEVRWCPGCGDYAILSSLQATFAKLGKPKENIVCISGIGCSSRFPYYVDSFGMHTIHGRAPAIASGLKLHNPDLSVWVITGDGDCLSIGGNHLIHALRRNLDINIVLFNNEIYGLTKGQYSPTSHEGLVTKSSPYGSIDHAFTPAKLALGAGATFYARTIDKDPKHMMDIFDRAAAHKGTSFVEVYQNCVIFNDKIHEKYTAKGSREENSIRLEHGKPMVFGKDNEKGLKLNNLKLEVVDIVNGDTSELLIHDENNANLAALLANLDKDTMPVPIGVFLETHIPTYEQMMYGQIEQVQAKKGHGDMQTLLTSGEIFEIN